MNKKVEKAIGKALAASLVTGVAASVAPSVSAAEVDFNQLYKTAYNAVTKAKAEGTQAAINEARTAINALKGTKAEFAVGEFSKQVDTVQGPKLVKIVKAILAAQVSGKQADINAAKALIEPELPATWRNPYSQAADDAQRALIAKVEAAVTKAAETKTAADIATAKALVDDLKTATSTAIANLGVEAEKKLAEVTPLLKVESVAAVNSKTLAVTFDRELSDTEKAAAKFTVKKDNFVLAVKAVVWEGKVAKFVKVDDSKLLSGTYEVKYNDLAAVTTTYAGEQVKQISVTTNRIKDAAAQVISVAGKNQFGEDVDVAKTALTVVAYNKTTKANLGTIADIAAVDLSASTAVADKVQITAYLTADPSVMTIKEITVDNFTLGTVSFAEPVLLTNTTRITAGQTGIELPYTATDNAGEAYKLPQSAAKVNLEANTGVIVNLVNVTGISVDANNKLFLDLTGSSAGTATVQIINTLTGTIFSKSFQVYAAAGIDSVSLAVPANTVYAVNDGNYTGKLTLSALDQYSVALTNAQIDAQKLSISLSSSNQAVVANASLRVNASGQVEFTPAGEGTTTIFAVVGSKVTSIQVEVKAERYTKEVVVKEAPATNLVQGGAVTTVKYDLKDQYETLWPDAKDIAAYKVNLSVEKVSGDDNGITLSTTGDLAESAVVGDSFTITSAAGKTGSYKVIAKVIKASDSSVVSQVVTPINVIADNAAGLTLALESVPTLYAIGNNFNSEYAKTVSVYATDANGVKTVFPASSFIGLTSDNTGVANVDPTTKKVVGIAKGTAKLTAVVNTKDGIKTVQTTVTVSDEARAPQSIKVDGTNVNKDNNTLSIAQATIDGIDLDTAAELNFVVADQFGGVAGLEPVTYLVTNVTDSAVVVGSEFTSADVTVDATGVITVTADAATGDTFKITGVTSNGKVATITITIQ